MIPLRGSRFCKRKHLDRFTRITFCAQKIAHTAGLLQLPDAGRHSHAMPVRAGRDRTVFALVCPGGYSHRDADPNHRDGHHDRRTRLGSRADHHYRRCDQTARQQQTSHSHAGTDTDPVVAAGDPNSGIRSACVRRRRNKHTVRRCARELSFSDERG